MIIIIPFLTLIYFCQTCIAEKVGSSTGINLKSFISLFLVNVAEMMNLAVDRLPTFVGIKYTSNDLDKGVAALRANNGKFAVFLGADTVCL